MVSLSNVSVKTRKKKILISLPEEGYFLKIKNFNR